MKKMNLIILSTLSLLIFTACTSMPVRNVNDVKIRQSLTKKQVAEAIIDAATRRKWNVIKEEANVIQLSISPRKHTLTVDVPFSEEMYSINYVSSENLNYDAKSGTVHKKAYKWMLRLRKDIDKALSRVGN